MEELPLMLNAGCGDVLGSASYAYEVAHRQDFPAITLQPNHRPP
ncbi:MAG: hypothetical protein ACLTXL_12580 [Clostridia bacterium]